MDASSHPTRIRFSCSPRLVDLLGRHGSTMLVTTYQAGKVLMVRACEGQAATVMRSFDRPMGVAPAADRLAIATREQIWFLADAPGIAAGLRPRGRFDGCFLPRRAHVTGDVRVHEIAWAGEELWIVNTRYSCLATLDNRFSFVPQWRPPFVSALEPEDRCHLNGLAMAEGRPRYATALGATDSPGGWREDRAGGGCLIEVRSGEIVARGLSMPHSPRLRAGKLWLLESGTGRLLLVDTLTGRTEPAAELPGYARGLAILGGWALVGLSRVRDTSTFRGLPLHRRRHPLRCGVWLVELDTGQVLPGLEFHDGVSEIFDVQVLAGRKHPAFVGLKREAIRRLIVVPEPSNGS